MPTQTQPRAISDLGKVAIGLGEAAVVLVEAGSARGYLIAESYRIGELPSEIILANTIYLYSEADELQLGQIPEVLISCRHDWWSAVDPEAVTLIPCPSPQPYPILFISKHGYEWMLQMIIESDFDKLLDHLRARFVAATFATDRRILDDPNSPFFHLPSVVLTTLRRE